MRQFLGLAAAMTGALMLCVGLAVPGWFGMLMAVEGAVFLLWAKWIYDGRLT